MREKQSFFHYITRPKFFGLMAITIFLLIWWGIPAFNKWQADKMVDGLCAKDAGIKVYEIVKLPAEKFSESNRYSKISGVYVPSQKYAKSTDEYYYTSETQWIIPDGPQIGDLDLRRYHTKLYRVKDGKLLAEGVGYSRRGGDAVGPWHPSSYGCVRAPGTKNMNQQVFIRE
ncbi:MAG: hypothetical protein COB30_021205 [Ectothiorhodospiraceae bacterium]|nr:hypothetical protein [Ectothiorhodospiraceae bacterium]